MTSVEIYKAQLKAFRLLASRQPMPYRTSTENLTNIYRISIESLSSVGGGD